MDEALNTDIHVINVDHMYVTVLEEPGPCLLEYCQFDVTTLSHHTNKTGVDMDEALDTDIHVINSSIVSLM